jgi:hypothetical protein
MQEIDALIEDNTELSLEMIECDIRNKQAHEDLAHYNEYQTFKYLHPFTKREKIYNEQKTELLLLKKNNPESFIKESTNVLQNIRRIESNIRSKKYKSEDELQSWTQNLTRANVRKEIITEIITE